MFVIAEAGVNHNGDPRLAADLIDAAAAAGADAVKFQTFRAEALVTATAPRAAYQQVNDPGGASSQRAMLNALELSADEHRSLLARTHDRGLVFLSTPFDSGSADLLDELGVPAFKVSSGDLTHLPFLAELAVRGRPMILSTGMATMDEVAEAVVVVENHGASSLALLHCVSCYPADPADANLRAMNTMADRFTVPVGWSDHTDGIEVSIAATALGACIIEKHLTLDRTMEGPDHAASLEPDAFAAMVRGIRSVESALGSGVKSPVEAERDVALVARRSVVAAVDLKPGVALQAEQLVVRRPGTGLAPKFLPELIGRTVRNAVAAGTPITGEMLSP